MIDTRNLNRDSLFLTATLHAGPAGEAVRVKVRNLSDGGMMAEGLLALSRGDRVTVELRNTKPVRGVVAWTQGNRFGIAFEEEIDAKATRAVMAVTETAAPRHTRPIGFYQRDPSQLRKL